MKQTNPLFVIVVIMFSAKIAEGPQKKSDRPVFLHVVHRVFQAIVFFCWHLVPEWDKPDKRFFQDRDEEA